MWPLLIFSLISSTLATCPLGSNFSIQFNKCYKNVIQPAIFPVAEKRCESMGGNLVTVSNTYENSYVSGIVSDPFWIGLNSLSTADWTWINGDLSTYRNWAPSEPSVSRGAVQMINGQWTATDPNIPMSYLCQIDPNAVVIPVSCPAGRCPDPSYTLNPATCKCYKNAGVENYSGSIELCAADNATLPIILNEADNNFIRHFSPDVILPFLGLNCQDSTTCLWQNGSPLGYSKFAQGFSAGNPYAIMYASTASPNMNGYWFPNDGIAKSNCICQKMGIP